MSDLFDNVPSQLVDRARRRLCVSIDDCISQIGGMKVAEGATGATRQHLRDTLSDREGRLLEVRWPWRIALLSAEPLRAAVASALVEPLGFSITPIKPLTTEEKLARLEYRVATELGAAGLRIVEENKR